VNDQEWSFVVAIPSPSRRMNQWTVFLFEDGLSQAEADEISTAFRESQIPLSR